MTTARVGQFLAEVPVSSSALAVSQFLAEALSQSPGAQVAQFLAELLVFGPAVRVGQFLAEPVVSGLGARAAQFLIEVLTLDIEIGMPSIFPTLQEAFSVTKRPTSQVGVSTSGSGRAVRVGYATAPIWEWELTYEVMPDQPDVGGATASDLKTMLGFFLAHTGSLGGFCYEDPDDNAVTGQVLGTTDGASTTWMLSRTYGLGSAVGTEPIGYVNTGAAFHVYLDGVLTDPSTYDVLTTTPVSQMIRFHSVPASGKVITADFGFYYWVRFKDPTNDYEKFADKFWAVKKVTLQSLRGP